MILRAPGNSKNLVREFEKPFMSYTYSKYPDVYVYNKKFNKRQITHLGNPKNE